ncbi:polysaccharide biosynthesis C-terminal domain-containing protein [Tenacibaculum sp. TC6]|uniref:polysaccharide biosynthesis C-terminal domain-containing protein n=1 Tax=Tenacibaculum sp. TC6 TaxID=3423223 RepID=UPI003D36B781
MTLLKNYITGFLNRSGGYVFTATIASRVLSFITSWIALQLLTNKSLGEVLYAWNIITFLMPFIGFGLHQSYIRYGAITHHTNEKEALLYYVLKKGILTSFFLSLIVGLVGFIFPFKISNTGIYLSIFSFIFVPSFLVEVIKIKARLFHQNKQLAFIEIIYHCLLIVLVSLLSYVLKEIGYIIAFITTPIFVVFIFRHSIINTPKLKKPSFIDIEFWKYGFFGGLSNVASMLLFAIDILLIGYLLEDSEKVTVYRYISLIPFSILFLPRVFITTDFVAFTERITHKTYIYNYIKSYMLLFTILSISFVSFFFIFKEYTLNLFDSSFTSYTDSFVILNIGVCGVLIFRGLFGNLLSSIGKIKVNYYITGFAILINCVSNYYLIPSLGIKGAAITSASLLWFTGLSSCIAFFYYYKPQLPTSTV